MSEALVDAAAPVKPPPRVSPWPAAAWAVGAILNYVVMALCIRALANRLPASDITFYRAFFGLILTLPFVFGAGLPRAVTTLKTRRLPLFALRAVLTYAAILTYFYAVTKIPLAEAVALNSTLPIFMTALAAIVLGERVGAGRWFVILLGFAGALVIIRPGFAEVSWAAIGALVSAACYGAAGVVVKLLSRTEPPGRIVLYMNLLIAPLAAIPLFWSATLPAWSDLPFVLAIGAAGTMAHFCQSNALKRAEASFVAPFDFLRLPLAALGGYILFSDSPSNWVWAGAALVFVSTFWLARGGKRKVTQ